MIYFFSFSFLHKSEPNTSAWTSPYEIGHLSEQQNIWLISPSAASKWCSLTNQSLRLHINPLLCCKFASAVCQCNPHHLFIHVTASIQRWGSAHNSCCHGDTEMDPALWNLHLFWGVGKVFFYFRSSLLLLEWMVSGGAKGKRKFCSIPSHLLHLPVHAASSLTAIQFRSLCLFLIALLFSSWFCTLIITFLNNIYWPWDWVQFW